MTPETGSISWLELAREFVDHKWRLSSPRHRKSVAEALTHITVALTDAVPHDTLALRRAVFGWELNTGRRDTEPPPDIDETRRWLARHSVPVSQLMDSRTLHQALNSIAFRLDGEPTSAATFRRRRSALNSALDYAVDMSYLSTNPLTRSSWSTPAVGSGAVDRQVVANPHTARALLAAVRDISPATEAFFACLYYAGMRPAEAVNLRVSDCELPETGWGRISVHGSYQVAGTSWTRSGHAGEEQSLKHRALGESRNVPAHPELVETLRRHLSEFGTGVETRLFVARTGKAGVPLPMPYSNPLSMGTVYRVWHKARASALTPQQLESKLARRPYDLRHACVSTWLNAGVPPTQAAAWAGHSVAVLLKVYAKCIDGQEAAAIKRVEAAMLTDDGPD